MKKYLLHFMMIFMAVCLTGCSSEKEPNRENTDAPKTFTAFIAVPEKSVTSDNRIMNVIAEKIGAKADISYLSGQTDTEYISSLIQKGRYPDLIDGYDGTHLLLEANAYIALDDYLDDYPNIKDLLTEAEWNQMRQSDGHIYFIPQFYKVNQQSTSPTYSDEAFWIQKRVLEWAGYPHVQTLDEYFDLIESYLSANPTEADGQKTIGFEILCYDWRYFCLENVPQFLAGYPNDGCAIVNPDTGKVSVYDTIPEAKQYYQRLNREYNLDILDPETFTLSYEEYLEKISSGNVLGMVDQYWQFQNASESLLAQKKYDRTYVPLGITANASVTEQYAALKGLNSGNGLGISVSCQDVEGALQFLDDLLKPEIMELRYWGERGIDFNVNEDGSFYRTEEQRANAADAGWVSENLCSYPHLPRYEGMLADGINTVLPEEQPVEYYSTLNDVDKRILDAYGYQRWTDFLNSPKQNSPWFPLYTATANWPSDTAYGKALNKMEAIKRQWLPKVIMSSTDDFEQLWSQYMETYETEIDVDAYENELTKEVARRIAISNGE